MFISSTMQYACSVLRRKIDHFIIIEIFTRLSVLEKMYRQKRIIFIFIKIIMSLSIPRCTSRNKWIIFIFAKIITRISVPGRTCQKKWWRFQISPFQREVNLSYTTPRCANTCSNTQITSNCRSTLKWDHSIYQQQLILDYQPWNMQRWHAGAVFQKPLGIKTICKAEVILIISKIQTLKYMDMAGPTVFPKLWLRYRL